MCLAGVPPFEAGAVPLEGLHLQSASSWKYWSRSSSSRTSFARRAGSTLAAVAIALTGLASSSLRAHAEKIPTETQLLAETTRATDSRTGAITTVSIHVAATDGDAIPSGIVTLVDGTHPVGSALIDESGDAKIEAANLTPGTHSLHAIYAGTGELAGSLSPETQVTSEATGVADFSIVPASTSLTVAQGSAVTTILTLAPINGFSGYITLSCSNLPVDTACNFVPSNVFVGGTASTPTTLSIPTSGPTGPTARNQMGHHTGTLFLALLLPGVFSIAGLGLSGRRTWQQLCLALAVIALAGGLGGCSQRYHYLNRPPLASPGTPLGASTFSLQAQAISGTTVIQHSLNFTLTVTAK